MPAAMAQDVLTQPPSPGPLLPSAVQEYQTNQASQFQVFIPAGTARSGQPEPQIFRWGPVLMRPHLDYQFLYGNGIESSPGQQHKTIVQQVSPGAMFDVGAHWTLDYTPTLSFYSSSNFRDTLNQNVQLNWGSAYNDWFLNGSQSYSSTSDPNEETATQTGQQTYATAFNASYQFNKKVSLDLGFNQNFNYIGNSQSSAGLLQNLASSRSWSTMNWLNYQFWPRLSAGLGLGMGYNQQDNSPDSIDEQYQARVNWRATDKVSFQLSGGLEDQQYLSGGAGALESPIFGATIQYQPFKQTEISVTANRTVSSSAFQGQVTESTSITCDLNQRLFGHLHLDVSGGYNSTKYVSSFAGFSTGRSDDTYTLTPRLSFPCLKRGSIAVFYDYSKNSSTQTGFAAGSSAFSYSSSQIGIEISYRY